MRRRSERKKSADVSPPARRSRRRKSENEKNAENEKNTEIQNRGSSEEPLVEKSSRRGRNSRRRTPEKRSKSRRSESPEKVEPMAEENNGGMYKISENNESGDAGNVQQNDDVDRANHDNEEGRQEEAMEREEPKIGDEEGGTRKMEVTAEQICEEKGSEKEVISNSRSLSPKAMVEEKSKTSDVLDIREDSQEDNGERYDGDRDIIMRSFSPMRNENSKCNDLESVSINKGDDDDASKVKDESPKETMAVTGEDKLPESMPSPKEHVELDSNENSVTKNHTNSLEPEKVADVNENHADKKPQEKTVRTRKRKWLTKRTESKAPILAISTDSLKGLISDVHPVPLSDVRLDSSPEVEEVVSEREEGEETPSPERLEERDDEKSVRKTFHDADEKVLEKPAAKRAQKEPITAISIAAASAAATVPAVVPNTAVHLQRSPSPPRNKTSHVLYITNLVRPFTVLQLKGLLARTGKIVEDGFWIDRIKSKCYVEYETEDEAIETRHALHGVRWPVSNPKCLNVDFGSKADMQRAIDSTKEDGPKLSQDNKDNIIIGTGWSRGERNDDVDRKPARPVREWDVGKKENLDREKNREVEKRRSRERDRERDREKDRVRDKDRERERDISANRDRENEKTNDRKARNRGRERSHSSSPARKIIKKENEPPLRLLDDLFRKTKAAPCVYWLPLTPEQIAEKEAFRQKRIQEHQERIKQRELERETEREKEREKERNRGSDRDRDRDRDRRNRSNDRRRSRSRDRRRY